MSDTESKRPKKMHILPFATPAKNRLKDFTKNMEMAAVLYLAEGTRKKGEHPHLRKKEEKLVFITKACYPIWLIPYNKTTLIFDGLGLASHTFIYDKMPDVEVFNEEIQRCEKTTDSYIATLTRNMDHFRDFQGKEEIRIEGLVTTPDLKEDIRTCRTQMKQGKKLFNNIVFLKPETKKHEIQTGIKQLSALRKKVNKDIDKIDASMKFLNASTARRVKATKEENKRIQETYSRQIKKTRIKSTERLRQIRKQHNKKIAKVSKKYKKRLHQLNKKQIRLKKQLKSLRTKIEQCRAKIKSSKRRNSERYENHWTKKLEKVKKNRQVLRKEIEVNSKRTRDVKKAQKGELAKQRNACCRRIEVVNKTFRDRQGSREAEIIMNRQDIATIEEITRYITRLMQRMLKKKKFAIVNFERIAMSQVKQPRRLMYIPFYLVRYEKGDKRRYVMYPPSIVGDIGVLAKMKGALGVAKVKTLIQPRSEAMVKFLNQLLVFFEKKPMFEKDVTEAGIQKSMLINKKLRVAVVKGLKQLRSENWISRKELQAFCKILYTYAPLMNQQLHTILISENNYLKCLTT
jgi:hypothetical protein